MPVLSAVYRLDWHVVARALLSRMATQRCGRSGQSAVPGGRGGMLRVGDSELSADDTAVRWSPGDAGAISGKGRRSGSLGS